jgi:IS5 family transposase
MNKQLTLSALTDELAQARTRKKEFPERLERIIPWSEWMGIIKPYYYAGERGNKPYEPETMLRIHLLQELYDLADMAVMNEVIDSRDFAEWIPAIRYRMGTL